MENADSDGVAANVGVDRAHLLGVLRQAVSALALTYGQAVSRDEREPAARPLPSDD
jgi:hypothetical protein